MAYRFEVVREAVPKIYKGDSLSDDELEATLSASKEARDLLANFGERFHFAFQEMNRIITQLEGWKRARERQ